MLACCFSGCTSVFGTKLRQSDLYLCRFEIEYRGNLHNNIWCIHDNHRLDLFLTSFCVWDVEHKAINFYSIFIIVITQFIWSLQLCLKSAVIIFAWNAQNNFVFFCSFKHIPVFLPATIIFAQLCVWFQLTICCGFACFSMPVSSEISDLRNSWLRTTCVCADRDSRSRISIAKWCTCICQMLTVSNKLRTYGNSFLSLSQVMLYSKALKLM